MISPYYPPSTMTSKPLLSSPPTSCSAPANLTSSSAVISTLLHNQSGVHHIKESVSPIFGNHHRKPGKNSSLSTATALQHHDSSNAPPEITPTSSAPLRNKYSTPVSLGTPFGVVALRHGPIKGNLPTPSANLAVGGPTRPLRTTFFPGVTFLSATGALLNLTRLPSSTTSMPIAKPHPKRSRRLTNNRVYNQCRHRNDRHHTRPPSVHCPTPVRLALYALHHHSTSI